MYFFYSILLSIGFLLMSPLFLLRREKYASGFAQRLGNYPEFKHDGRDVIWLHCVSVGEANAARPLVTSLREEFPDHRIVISTTTKTGQELARKIFAGLADAIVYFPFDFKFSVRRALEHFKPSLVLLMETEIWPRFIHEAKLAGAKVAIVNGRLSAKSVRRYGRVGSLVRSVLSEVDMALMQDETDAAHVVSLGMGSEKVSVTGNVKFDQSEELRDTELTEYFRTRFLLDGHVPLVVAASTHDPEENWIIDALETTGLPFRLVIAPRHPERFEQVLQDEIVPTDRAYSRRSDPISPSDKDAEIILLDSIGELRAIYPLADVVFVGGSLIPHGGQSILEPAAAGAAIITGPFTHNFSAAVATFRSRNALIQLSPDEDDLFSKFYKELADLLANAKRREEVGKNARAAFRESRGATERTIAHIQELLSENSEN